MPADPSLPPKSHHRGRVLTADAATPRGREVRGHLRELLRLAWPIVIARAGILTMALADVAMVGRHDTDELAYASLGTALFVPLLVTGVGLMIGVLATASQAFGSERLEACGAIWMRALPWATLVGAIAALVCLQGEAILGLIGQEPVMAREGGRVAVALAPGLFAYGLFVASTFFLEAINRPTPGMVAMLVANVINVALNWVLIYGELGFPAMGAVGSAITTSVVRTFLAVFIILYILRMPDRRRFGIDAARARVALATWWPKSREARRIGLAAGAATGLETSAHAALTQIAGLMGVVPVGAYAIAHNVEAVMFMAALGIGSATGVLTGNAWGRGDRRGAAMAGWTGIGATLGVMAACGLLIWLLRGPILGVYSTDPRIVAASLPVMAVVAVAIVADGAQMTAAHATRALGDAWNATARAAVAFWLVMVPGGWAMGVWLGWGPAGLMAGVVIGCAVAFVLMAERFTALLRSARP